MKVGLTNCSIWDHFRSQFPFLVLVDPLAMEQIIQGLLTLYDIQGWLPDCHMSLSKGYTQGGSNADVVMADAYSKLNSTNIDWNKVYEAVVRDAEEEPYGESLRDCIGAMLIRIRLVLPRTWWPRQLEVPSLHSR